MNKQDDIIKFYDLKPTGSDFQEEVLEGLHAQPKTLSPKFFYDERGSQLFVRIFETPEYYPTRTETAILRDNLEDIARQLGPGCVLVEPGSGDSTKVRELLDVLRPFAYMPIDISSHFLEQEARKLASEFPWLDVHAVCTDVTNAMTLPYAPEDARMIAFFPGSTIGNFTPDDAEHFLRDLKCMVGDDGGLLIGVDLVKDPAILNAAYNDADGITAEFNLNLLQRINRELEGDFALDRFSHQAFFNAGQSRIEMHLVSKIDQQVNIAGHRLDFAQQETIHTENSYKYSVAGFQALAQRAGFEPEKVWTDSEDWFSLQYFRCR